MLHFYYIEFTLTQTHGPQNRAEEVVFRAKLRSKIPVSRSSGRDTIAFAVYLPDNGFFGLTKPLRGSDVGHFPRTDFPYFTKREAGGGGRQ